MGGKVVTIAWTYKYINYANTSISGIIHTLMYIYININIYIYRIEKPKLKMNEYHIYRQIPLHTHD